MSRPGLRWVVWRLALCNHSHNAVGTRPSKVGKVMNRSPDVGISAACSPSATERGEASLTGAAYAARARKDYATRVRRAAGATSSE